MILLGNLRIPIRRNARCLLHGLGITPADGCALHSCRTGRWRILRTARLLWPCAVSCGIAVRSRTNALCRMGNWLFSCRTVLCGSWRCAAVRHRRISCHTGSRRSRCRRMFCCRGLSSCHVRSLHKGTALLRGFRLRISYLTAVRMVRYSCAANRLCRAARSGRRRNRIVWHCIWHGCIRCAPLCVRQLHEGAALLCGLALHSMPLRIAAVIRLSCGTGRLIGAARRILACRSSCRTGQHGPTVILHRRAAARLGFRLGMYRLFLLHILRSRAAHDGLHRSCGMIRRTGRGFSCRRRRHMARRTSGAGLYGCFPRGVGLFTICGRRCLRKCTGHLFGGGLYGIVLCRGSLRGNGFLTGYGIRTALLRRRAAMIAVCIRGRIDIGRIAAASARAGRCAWLGIPAAAARLMAIFADSMRRIGHQRANNHHCHRAGKATA